MRIALCGLLGLMIHPLGLMGQGVVSIASEPSCLACRIHLEHVTTLGLGEAAEHVEMTGTVAATPQGYVLATTFGATEIVEFDKDGRLLRILGRRGRGPGEYQRIQSIVSSQLDSLYVFDGRSLRMTVLSPDREVSRTMRLRALGGESTPVRLSDGGWILNASAYGLGPVSEPLDRVSADGELLESFGVVEGETRRGRVMGGTRWLQGGGGDSLWAAHHSDYRVDLFIGTTLTSSMVAEPPWKELPGRARGAGHPEGALIGIGRLPTGQLMLLSRIPDRGWADVVTRDGRGGFTVDDYGQFYDSVIDVVDPATGALLVRHVFDQFILRITDQSMVASVRQTPDGGEVMEIHRVSLVGLK